MTIDQLHAREALLRALRPDERTYHVTDAELDLNRTRNVDAYNRVAFLFFRFADQCKCEEW